METNPARFYLQIHAADSVFPLGRRIREGYAIAHTMVPSIPLDIALEAVDGMLAADPYGPSSLYHGVIHHLRANDGKAQELFRTMKALYPDWKQTKDLEALMAAKE